MSIGTPNIFIRVFVIFFRSPRQDSAVGIATGYGLDD
jgi:hypothetical protein